jgi:AhpC/TSA family
MASLAKFQTLEEAFLYCRDMDASLAERLEAFSLATRYLLPGYQEAVDSMAGCLKLHEAGRAAPKIGDLMPRFVLPDDNGELSLEQLLEKGPVAIVFHRGHWCPCCRINTRALAEVQEQIVGEGAQLTAITPERQWFAAELKQAVVMRVGHTAPCGPWNRRFGLAGAKQGDFGHILRPLHGPKTRAGNPKLGKETKA